MELELLIDILLDTLRVKPCQQGSGDDVSLLLKRSVVY